MHCHKFRCVKENSLAYAGGLLLLLLLLHLDPHVTFIDTFCAAPSDPKALKIIPGQEVAKKEIFKESVRNLSLHLSNV